MSTNDEPLPDFRNGMYVRVERVTSGTWSAHLMKPVGMFRKSKIVRSVHGTSDVNAAQAMLASLREEVSEPTMIRVIASQPYTALIEP